MVDLNTVADVAQGALTIIGGASVIAAATPTPKDDTILAKVRKVVELLALLVGFARKR